MQNQPCREVLEVNDGAIGHIDESGQGQHFSHERPVLVLFNPDTFAPKFGTDDLSFTSFATIGAVMVGRNRQKSNEFTVPIGSGTARLGNPQ